MLAYHSPNRLRILKGSWSERSTPAEVVSTKRRSEGGQAAMRLRAPTQSVCSGPLLSFQRLLQWHGRECVLCVRGGLVRAGAVRAGVALSE